MLLPGRKGMRLSRMSAKKYATMIGMLMREPHTITSMAQALGLSRRVVGRYVDALHKARPKLVHIAEWQQTRVATAPMWAAAYGWGGDRDEARPAKKSNEERCRDYKARRKMRALDALIAGASR
jgi:hypothetical protein